MKADYPKLTYRKHTFFSSLVSGLCIIIVTLLICGTVVIIYGMHFAGEKTEEIISLAQSTIKGLPAIQESLPPVFSDIINDRREPDYCDQLDITVEPTLQMQNAKRLGASVKVTNKGSEVVSLLSLRIVILNSNNEILAEFNEWVVTPFAIEDDWPGPLMPNSNRFFASGRKSSMVSDVGELKAEYEITDIRIWNGQKSVQSVDSNESSITGETDSFMIP